MKPIRRTMSLQFAEVMPRQRVITNFNMQDFEKVFVKVHTTSNGQNHAETPQNRKTRTKAKLLLQLTAEDSKGSAIFFDNEIRFGEVAKSATDDSSASPNRRAVIDFYKFYNEAIKGRMKNKLALEEQKAAHHPVIVPAVAINLDSDDAYPPILVPTEPPIEVPTQPVQTDESDSPPIKLPKRRGGAQDLSHLV